MLIKQPSLSGRCKRYLRILPVPPKKKRQRGQLWVNATESGSSVERQTWISNRHCIRSACRTGDACSVYLAWWGVGWDAQSSSGDRKTRKCHKVHDCCTNTIYFRRIVVTVFRQWPCGSRGQWEPGGTDEELSLCRYFPNANLDINTINATLPPLFCTFHQLRVFLSFTLKSYFNNRELASERQSRYATIIASMGYHPPGTRTIARLARGWKTYMQTRYPCNAGLPCCIYETCGF